MDSMGQRQCNLVSLASVTPFYLFILLLNEHGLVSEQDSFIRFHAQ